MYILKGFASYSKLHDNTVGATSPIGELSTHALTYAKEHGLYSNDTYPDAGLVSFRSYDSTLDELISVPVAFRDIVLEIAQWIYDNSINGTLQGTNQILLTGLTNNFGTVIEAIEVGAMISDTSYWMPEWISFKVSGDTTFDDNYIKIWFADVPFTQQYDEYEISFIAPLDNLDDFYLNATQVQSLVAGRSMTSLMLKIDEVKAKNPYTYLKSDSYDYHNPNDIASTIPTDWVVILYGIAGNSIDVIKRELQTWILANSSHTIEEWKVLFPDIFTNTEFIITPLWNQYAIPNRTIQAGVYSPISLFLSQIAEGLKTFKGLDYTRNHIVANMVATTSVYKSLSLIAVGGPDNRDGIMKLNEQFTDYIAVPTTSTDFNRMSIKTQEWITLLTEMLIVAEEMDEHSTIPLGMSRLTRDGVIYVVATYDDVQYLVTSKYSMENIPTIPVVPGEWVDQTPPVDNTYVVYLTDENGNKLDDTNGDYLVQ